MAAQADYEELRKELDKLRSDIAGLTRTLRDIAADRGSEAHERMRRSADRAQEQAAHTVEAVGHEIGERPFTSVLSAFILGVLIGMLSGRRS